MRPRPERRLRIKSAVTRGDGVMRTFIYELELSHYLFTDSACVPNAREKEYQGTARGKEDKKRRGKHVPGDERARC